MELLKAEDFNGEQVNEFKASNYVSKLYVDPLKKIEHQPIAISCGYKFESHVPIVISVVL